MPLTPEQHDKARTWLRHQLPLQPCHQCGGPEFAIGEIVNLTPIDGSPAFPVLTVSCNHCGHVRFFNAAIMELLGPTATGPQSAEDEPRNEPSPGTPLVALAVPPGGQGDSPG